MAPAVPRSASSDPAQFCSISPTRPAGCVPGDAARRYETIQWVFFQMAFIGPMFGQVGYFHKFAGREIADKRPLERYRDKSKRLLGVLETRLAGRQWIMGDDYTIADISILGWVRNLDRLLRRPRSRRVRCLAARRRPGCSAASPAPPCNAGWRSRSGRDARRKAVPEAASYAAIRDLAAPRQDPGSARYRAPAGDANHGAHRATRIFSRTHSPGEGRRW